MDANFITISCPSCGSPDVFSLGGANYRCKHCEGSFIYRHAAPAPPRPAAPPPPRQLTAPVASSYGPGPSAPSVVHVHTAAAPGRSFAWIWWILMMVLAFGGSGIAMVIGLFTSAAATVPKTPTVATPTPVASPVVTPTIKNTGHDPKAAKDEDAADEDDAPDNAAAAAAVAPNLDDFQMLKGCSCRPDSGAPKLDLYVRADSAGMTITAAGSKREVKLSFAVGASGREPTQLQNSGRTAPHQTYPVGRFPVGVGCEGDTLITAAGDRVTGWSLSDGSASWTHDLDASFGGVRAAENPSIDCKSLSTSKGVVTVRAGKSTARLNVADGEVAGSASSKKAPVAPKPEPAKPEPAKPEPAKPEPAKPEPAKPEPAKPEPAKPEPEKPQPKAGKKKKKKKKGKKKKKKKG